MVSESPNAIFSHSPQLLQTAYDLWKSGRYSQYKKAIFYTDDALSEEDRAIILNRIKQFRFEPPLIQVIGAYRDTHTKNMKYDESFLNMLQRIDFNSIKFTLEETTIGNQPIFTIKGTMIYIALLKQVLGTWLFDVKVNIVEG